MKHLQPVLCTIMSHLYIVYIFYAYMYVYKGHVFVVVAEKEEARGLVKCIAERFDDVVSSVLVLTYVLFIFNGWLAGWLAGWLVYSVHLFIF